MAKITVKDNRKITNPIFEEIRQGTMFTEIDGDVIYIKTEILKKKDFDANAVDLEGDTFWFPNDEKIKPIQEVEITIRR